MTKFLWIRKVLNTINLQADIHDYELIHENIEKDIMFKGTNLWILVFAILVASVGLNMNSTAVVIGAMLISPLMGPINGMGYSIATFDFPLFRKSVRQYTFAVGASLIASTAYFSITPISTAHSELLSRISPTIYDVLIALFGGLAGIVAIASKNKGNVIPGVAIATALMPPLCTAGYGLATAQFNYFFGAMYLFTINTVFIGISTIVISQILKFPICAIVNEARRKQINRWITVIIALVLIPSIYFGYKLVLKEKFSESAKDYVKSISVVEGNYLLKNEINPDKRSIKLIYGGATLHDAQKNRIRKMAEKYSLQKAKIDFQQGLSFDEITQKSSEVEKLKAEMNRLNLKVQEKENYIDTLQEVKFKGQQILNEIRILYPQIARCAYSDSYQFKDSVAVPTKLAVVVFSLNKQILSYGDKQKIEKWLKTRQHSNFIKVYYEE